jgi:hypothetical protein
MQVSDDLHHVSGYLRRGYVVDPIKVVCERYASNLAGEGEAVSSLEWIELGVVPKRGHLGVCNRCRANVCGALLGRLLRVHGKGMPIELCPPLGLGKPLDPLKFGYSVN